MISRRTFLGAAPAIASGAHSVLVAPYAGAAELGKETFRVATSSAMLGDVNENDARAALRSWADVVSGMVGMPIDYLQHSLCSPNQLLELMRKAAVDAIACTTPEYIPFAAYIDPSVVLITQNGVGYEYVLLVNAKSGFHTVADLRGHPLVLHRNTTTCLAMHWIESLLGASNLGPADRFFSGLMQSTKLSRTVLPVFFGQSDACLVTRSGFQTICELNPQLGVTLRPVATSPPYITALFGFHRDCQPAMKLKFQSALEGLTKSTTGKQLLALFQTEGFATRDVSALRSAVDVVEAAASARRRYAGAKS
jgi:phosphonate transport system substrate-binding protein